MAEETTPPPPSPAPGQPAKETPSSVVPAPGAGQTPVTTPPAEDLPEKFKGKSAADIAKSYAELEKEFGKNSEEVKTVRTQIAQFTALAEVIKSNPGLAKQVEMEIEKLAKGNQPDKTEKVDDTRTATTGIIIDKFEKESGLALLQKDDKIKIQDRVGEMIWTMRDPTHRNMTRAQAFNSIPLDQLPAFLNQSYKMVVSSSEEKEKAKLEALVETRQNNEAAMGSMSFSGVNAKENELTPEEKEVARKMHISEEKYLKNKIAISKGE
jgi:hypothetical protein